MDTVYGNNSFLFKNVSRDQNEDLEPEEAELGFPGRVLRRHAVGAKGLVGLRRPGVAYHQARRELEEAKGRIAPHKEPLPCFR